MRIRRTALLTVAFVILGLIGLGGAGCRGQLEHRSAEPPLRSLNLPRLRVSYDQRGEPTLLGLSLSTLERYSGSDLSMLRIPPEQIRQLMEWNLQHAELVLAPDGLFLFVNNEPLPYLGWDGETLTNLGRVVDRLEVLPESVARFTPAQRVLPFLLQGIGVGMVLELPVSPGTEAIPFESHPRGAPAHPDPGATEKPISLHVSLTYGPEGEPSFEGIKLQELSALMGQPGTLGSLDEGTMSAIRRAQIEFLLLRLESRGLVPYVDGQRLPYIAWSDEHMLHVIALVEATNPGHPVLSDPAFLGLLRGAAPGVTEADIQLSAQFAAQP